jgi:hypothetical protein
LYLTKSKIFDELVVNRLQVLDFEALNSIGGGETILNNPNVVENNAANFTQWASES